MNTNPALYLKLRNLQSSNMFLVMIPLIPKLSITSSPVTTGSDFMFLVRSTTIPQKTSEMRIVKTYNGRFTVPFRTEMTHEWTVKALMSEDGKVFDTMVQWYDLAQTVSDFYYADAYIIMMDLNYNATNVFLMKNIYPIETPALAELNQDGTDDIMEFDVKFSYDDIWFGESGELDWIFKLITPETIMNIAKTVGKV